MVATSPFTSVGAMASSCLTAATFFSKYVWSAPGSGVFGASCESCWLSAASALQNASLPAPLNSTRVVLVVGTVDVDEADELDELPSSRTERDEDTAQAPDHEHESQGEDDDLPRVHVGRRMRPCLAPIRRRGRAAYSFAHG